MNVQSIVINLDKGSFNVSFIPDSGLGLENYETINLFELEYYVNQLLLNGSGTGFFQMVKSGNLITFDKDGISAGNTIAFTTNSAVGLSTMIPFTPDNALTSTSPYTSKTNFTITFNNGADILTNIKFKLAKLSSGTFAGDYNVTLYTGAGMGAVSAVADIDGINWDVTIASVTVSVGAAQVLATALV